MALVTCCSLSQLAGIEKPGDINLFIVRNQKEAISNVTQFKYLAPSPELYRFAMENKTNPDWWEIYKRIFHLELQSVDKQIGLDIVKAYVNEGFDVNLICYCGDHTKCHRSLVAECLQNLGIEVRLL